MESGKTNYEMVGEVRVLVETILFVKVGIIGEERSKEREMQQDA
jgi:hypothetical protein